MSKKDYRVRNWNQYNKSLVARGSLTIWLEEGLADWYEPSSNYCGQGRPKLYSDTAIRCILMLKELLHLDFRRLEGLMCSLLALSGSKLHCPSYSQLCRRRKLEILPAFKASNKPIHLVIDSSGLKVYGEGEWKVRQHGASKHRMWRKLHIGVDEQTHQIVCAALTSNGCGDDKLLPKLLADYKGPLKQVSADGAYDSHANHATITSLGARSTIPIQQNPKHKPKSKENLKRPRDYIAWQVQQLGLREWKIQSGYHRRSLSETGFFRLKTLFGDKLSARKLKYEQVEGLLRCHILNKITTLGMPDSEATTT